MWGSAGTRRRRWISDWAEGRWTLSEVRSMLRQRPGESIGIKGIQNARLAKDLNALAGLRDAGRTSSAGELRRDVEQNVKNGIHPQALLDLESEDLGFRVFLSWAACRPGGSYDACFVPTRSGGKAPSAGIRWPQPEAADLVCFANAPGQANIRSALTRQLDAHCAESLPKDTGSVDIALVDMLPRMADGEVDVSALLAWRTASHLF